jgi:hypothetical protein
MSLGEIETKAGSGMAISQFPLEIMVEEFEGRFGSICQAWIYHKIGQREEINRKKLLDELVEDLESLLSTAPQKLVPFFRKRAKVIARRTLIKTREILVDDEEIKQLINLLKSK